MNLALRDVRHDLGRFLLTALGLGLLLATVLAMTGIYNGMVRDATALPDLIGADLWIVQRDTRGPFAELSRVPGSLEDRVRSVPGVLSARRFVQLVIQRARPDGRALRAMLVGLDDPEGLAERFVLAEGRAPRAPHFEMVADRSLGLALGEVVRLARDDYVVVGLVQNALSSSGDPIAFVSLADALRIQEDRPSEAIRLEREARSARVRASDLGRDTALVARARSPSSNVPVLGPPPVSAIAATLAPGADAAAARALIAGWADVSILSGEEQKTLLLGGVIERTRRQIGLFRALLVAISTIIMGLIVYTMTVDKLHSIALLKLIGAPTHTLAGMILEEALLLGGIAYVVALGTAAATFHHFPRRVVIEPAHQLGLLAVVVAISIVGSMAGIRTALAADPNRVLAS